MKAFITIIDSAGRVIVDNKEIKPNYTETVYKPDKMLYRIYNKYIFNYLEDMTREQYNYFKAFNKGE